MNSEIEYLHKIDTSQPGVYVVRLNCKLSKVQLNQIKDQFDGVLGENSKILLLDDNFAPVFIPDEETMEKLGWVKKQI